MIMDFQPSKLPNHSCQPDGSVAMTSPEPTQRRLLLHGPMKLTNNNQVKKRHAFLFSDVLLIANKGYKKQFKIKFRVPINNIWLAKNTVGQGDSPELKSLKLGWPLQNFTAKFLSVELKDKWHCFLERSITQSQKMNGLQNTLVKIDTSNINNSSNSAILAAHNLDTIKDVINMALPALGLTGSERDYQLWVRYGKTDTPFPLMGHENPYTIQEHYYRTSIHQSVPGKPTSPHILLESIPEILADGKLQFILKCRDKPKPQRRGAFFRNYLSCLSSAASQNDLSPDTDFSAQPIRLQMNDLTAIILEMLHFLRQNGPSTKGIFQNIDNVDSFLCLKERIMFGQTLNWENESPLVVAAALKDCLRIIPGTLFTMELYDSWLGVLDKDKVEIREIKRLLELLPVCNVDVLRQLCLCLYEISNNASFNLMSAPKLAFNITTSVFSLWKCTTQIASMESEIVKQMSIIEILIENYPQIFEDHSESLPSESWGDSSTSSGNSTNHEIIMWNPENGTVMEPDFLNWEPLRASTPKYYLDSAQDSGMEKELGLLGKHDEKPKIVGGTYVICPLPSEELKDAHGNV
ncbi:rho GTPase-activating protein 20-like [Ochotona curzoniae]|uniref:rho GTPase-activating protein 20-like n=1 Tax=Ochotona curzoniae TaxID=130825 RepID=UPI001B34AF4B|nr:rho GTPase-activating protein 20-like [Ochotona curzoniae]